MRSTTGPRGVRLAAAFALVAAVLGLGATPASATLTDNELGCDASADITAADGQTYHLDADDAEAAVPADGRAAWRGSLATATSDHVGEVRLAIGPSWDIELGSWGPSANAAGQTSAEGGLDLPAFFEDVPSGRYKLTGFHQGAEGRCAGEMVVEVDATPFSNIAGISGLLGTAFFGALLLLSALARTRS